MADSAVNEVAQLVDVIYTRFILRDLIGKVVPGAIALIGLSIALFGWPNVQYWMDHANGVEIVLLSALCWLSTICLQWLGEVGLRWVEYRWMVPWFRHGKTERPGKRETDNKENFSKRRKTLNQFLSVAEPHHLAIYERFVVIREAAGNTSTAVVIVLLSAVIRIVFGLFKHLGPAVPLSLKQQVAFGFCGVVVTYSLRAMYFEHKHRQEDYAELTVEMAAEQQTAS